MRRDDLLAQLIALPGNVEVVMQIGDVHVDITGLNYQSKKRTTVLPHLGDLRDALIEWGLPCRDAKRLIAHAMTFPEFQGKPQPSADELKSSTLPAQQSKRPRNRSI